MVKKYLYDGVEYASEWAVRQAIYKKERKAFGKPETVEDWEGIGVTVIETVDPVSPEPREPSLEELKQMKLGALDASFNEYRNSSSTFLVSSLGFKANANVTAFDNVSGLVAQLQYRLEKGEEAPKVEFMTFDDSLVALGLDEMKTLQVEISENNSKAYAHKWSLRQKIQTAENEDALSLISIDFFTHYNANVQGG